MLTCLMIFFHLISSLIISVGTQLLFQIKSATCHSIFNFQIIHQPSIHRNIQDVT